jgi:hypothetical protein
VHVLCWDQQEKAREWLARLALQDRGELQQGPYTVKTCVEDSLKCIAFVTATKKCAQTH